MRVNVHLSAAMIGVLAIELIGAQSADGARNVSPEEARGLVLAALPSETRRLPGFTLRQHDVQEFPQFYFFTAIWIGAPNGSLIAGDWAVDRSTADVWSALRCEEESTSTLRKLQSKLRKTIGLTDAEYQRAKKKGPMCP